MSNWIQDAEKEMEDKGTVGAFTKQAKDSGMSVQDFAMKVKENPSDYTETTRKRAQFALNMEKIAKNNKMAKGGETQGFNDKLNEDLGDRLGRESGYEQSLKDRRDESKAANKNLNRRAYSSVETMDEGDKMFMRGGETQGYDDRDKESIGERNKGAKSQSLDSRMRESVGTEESMGRRKYADVSTMDKGKRKMARGGSVEGKIDRDRYVKLRREKDKEIAKLKKEKGALRKETITKDKCDDKIEKVESKKVDNTEDTNNQTLLVGGIAGILLGAFFIGR